MRDTELCCRVLAKRSWSHDGSGRLYRYYAMSRMNSFERHKTETCERVSIESCRIGTRKTNPEHSSAPYVRSLSCTCAMLGCLIALQVGTTGDWSSVVQYKRENSLSASLYMIPIAVFASSDSPSSRSVCMSACSQRHPSTSWPSTSDISSERNTRLGNYTSI